MAVRMLSSAMQELRDLRSAFASERTAFRADQAAFCVRAQMAGCIPSSLQPDASTLSIVATDTFEVSLASLESLGLARMASRSAACFDLVLDHILALQLPAGAASGLCSEPCCGFPMPCKDTMQQYTISC